MRNLGASLCFYLGTLFLPPHMQFKARREYQTANVHLSGLQDTFYHVLEH